MHICRKDFTVFLRLHWSLMCVYLWPLLPSRELAGGIQEHPEHSKACMLHALCMIAEQGTMDFYKPLHMGDFQTKCLCSNCMILSHCHLHGGEACRDVAVKAVTLTCKHADVPHSCHQFQCMAMHGTAVQCPFTACIVHLVCINCICLEIEEHHLRPLRQVSLCCTYDCQGAQSSFLAVCMLLC